MLFRSVELDKDLIAGLQARGFKWDMGEDGAGHQMKIRTRFGGYYLNAGCSDLIINGQVGLLQHDQIDRFVATGARLRDGSIHAADLVVLATGFMSQQELVGQLFGEDMAHLVNEMLDSGNGVPDAFCRLGSRLHHLLVDEFQDTSRDQWRAAQRHAHLLHLQRGHPHLHHHRAGERGDVHGARHRPHGRRDA